jgi:hypothetical protein
LVIKPLSKIFYGYHTAWAGAPGNVRNQPITAAPARRIWACDHEIFALWRPDPQLADAVERDAFVP